MNNFRAILRWAMALAACGAAFGADPPPRVKCATVLPRGTSAHQALLEMQDKWRQAGVKPVLYADATQGGEAEIVRRMRIDQLQCGVLSVSGLMEIDRSVTALQLMPMVFRSLDEVGFLRDKLHPLLEKRLEEKGFVALTWADAGWVQIFSRKPVLRPDDLKKQKVFVLQSDSGQVDLMKSLGFDAVSLELTDILTGLQTGQIDAVPTTPFYALAGQFYRPAPYMLEMNYVPLAGAIVVTRKTWDALPSATRDAVRRSAEEAGNQITLHSRREMQESVAAMQKRGLKVTRMTPETEREWRAFFSGVYPRIRGTLVPADLFDEVQRLLEEYRK